MKRAACIALGSIALLSQQVGAEIFKCVDDSGNVTFVNDPNACPDAQPHELTGRVDRASSSIERAAEETPDRGEISSPVERLEWALLDERDVRPDWDIVPEMPEDPTQDEDLVEWHVVATRTRHYTRRSGADSQVCSVELWAFEDEARARLAHQNFEFPNWRIDRRGDTLVMLRAVTIHGESTERAIYPDCEKLGDVVRSRAAKFAGE